MEAPVCERKRNEDRDNEEVHQDHEARTELSASDGANDVTLAIFVISIIIYSFWSLYEI